MSFAQLLPAEIARMIPEGVDVDRAIANATAEEIEWFQKTLKQVTRQSAEELATAQQREAEERARQQTAAEQQRFESSLAEFFKQAWAFLEPGHPLRWSWHYELLCEYLTLVEQKSLRRLIINVPPRTAKSTLVTKCFPVWGWTRHPEVSFMFASYSKDLSTDHSVHRRSLIASNWFQTLWAEKFKLSSDRNLTTQFSNDKMGTMIATSTGSGAEGKGCDIAVLDDPMSSQEALSDAERLASNRWLSNTLKQRLNNPATAAIVIIMQRLHEMDTVGYVEQEDPGVWTKIEIPLVAEKDEVWTFPISGRVYERKRGEVLQPERFTPAVVEEKQRGRLVYSGQYQQHPAPLEGNLIKRSEVRYYGGKNENGEPDEKLPERFDMVLISADCAFKDLKSSDYVAVGTIGVYRRKRIVLNLVNAHLDLDGTETEIRRQREAAQARGWVVSAVLVEDKANGSSVIKRLKSNISGVIAIEPEGGKIARMFAVAPEWEAGDWYVDRTAMWTEPFIQQITQFPLAAHDDMCDMMSQAGIWLGAANRALGLVDYLKSGGAQKELQRIAEAQQPKLTAKAGENGGDGRAESDACPKCGNNLVSAIAGQKRCQQCGAQWTHGSTAAALVINRANLAQFRR